MARTKAFDRDEALDGAMAVFWDKGYAAVATEELLEAMHIDRQTMYDTFGDKHSLYLEALRRYQAGKSAAMLGRLRAGGSPLSAIGDVLMTVANETAAERKRGCLAVSATTERAQCDPDVAAIVADATVLYEAAFAHMVREAQRAGEVDRSVDERKAGRFLVATLQGLRVLAKTGETPAALRDVVTVALDGLRPRLTL
jgi:AcrR family transcriptional regulator